MASSIRPLNDKEVQALQKFLNLEISLEELRSRLKKVVTFKFASDERRLETNFVLPEPGIRVELKHIAFATSKHSEGALTAEELADWATMLLLNSAYDWGDNPEEDEIAERLNALSTITLRAKI